jgi:hypothetical protein
MIAMFAAAPPHRIANDAPQVNPVLDRAALATQFRQRGRIQIGDILTKSAADRV